MRLKDRRKEVFKNRFILTLFCAPLFGVFLFFVFDQFSPLGIGYTYNSSLKFNHIFGIIVFSTLVSYPLMMIIGVPVIYLVEHFSLSKFQAFFAYILAGFFFMPSVSFKMLFVIMIASPKILLIGGVIICLFNFSYLHKFLKFLIYILTALWIMLMLSSAASLPLSSDDLYFSAIGASVAFVSWLFMFLGRDMCQDFSEHSEHPL